MTKSFFAATALSLALTASAFAADLPSYKAPLIAPPPAFTWTGLYGGVNIGYGFGNGDQDRGGLGYYATPGAAPPLPAGTVWTVVNNLNGVLGGGQAGFNYQSIRGWSSASRPMRRRPTCIARAPAMALLTTLLGDSASLSPRSRIRLTGSARCEGASA